MNGQPNLPNSSREEKSVNLIDIFVYLGFHWKWFLVSLLIFVGYFGYEYYHTAFVYSRSMIVMIKTPTNSEATMRLNRYNSFVTPVNVSSEILQFRSKELMRNVVERLHADVSYVVRDGLRNKELYTTSPIRVAFLDGTPQHCFLMVTPRDKKRVMLSGFSKEGSRSMLVNLNDTVSTPLGRLVVYGAENYASFHYRGAVQVTRNDPVSVATLFLSNLSIKQMEEDAAMLSITLNDFSPVRATDVLNMLITVYNEEAIEEKNRVGVHTAEFIKKRLMLVEDELGSVEGDIERLKKENEGVGIDAAAQMYVSDSRQYLATLKELETQLRLARLMKEHLRESEAGDGLIPVNTGLVDMNIESQISQYNVIVLKRNRLIEGSSDKNPVVQELSRAIVATRANINRAVENLIAGLTVKENDFRSQEKQARSKVETVPGKEREMLSIERQQKVKEGLYIFLLNKREENALNQAMVDDNVRIVDAPSGNYAPIYPQKLRKLALGACCGVTLPMVILLLIMVLDTRIRSRKEIEDVVTIPFLGEIPMAAKKITDVSDMLKRVKEYNRLSEAFRILRTNISFMAVDARAPQVIVLTSFNVGAGKTFLSLNLAASFIQTQKKVVIIDLDLRKGMLSRMLNIKKMTGITHYLSNQEVVIDDVICPDCISEHLDVIPVGAIAPNPSELLLSNRLDELMAELRKRYDYIIVDNVPMGLVADASIVNRITDLTLFVIRSGNLDRRMLPELERIHLEHKLTNMAIVLNGVKKGAIGYGYGYGYGYGDDERKKSRKEKRKKDRR